MLNGSSSATSAKYSVVHPGRGRSSRGDMHLRPWSHHVWPAFRASNLSYVRGGYCPNFRIFFRDERPEESSEMRRARGITW
jgi:hypothetical protein